MRRQSHTVEFTLEAKTACCQLFRWRVQGRGAAVHKGVFISQQFVHCKISLQSAEMKICTRAAETCADWGIVCAKQKDKAINTKKKEQNYNGCLQGLAWMNAGILKLNQHTNTDWKNRQICWGVWVCLLYYLALNHFCVKILEECVSVRVSNDIVIALR